MDRQRLMDFLHSPEWKEGAAEYLRDLARSKVESAGLSNPILNPEVNFKAQGAREVLLAIASEKFPDQLGEYLDKHDRPRKPDGHVRV